MPTTPDLLQQWLGAAWLSGIPPDEVNIALQDEGWQQSGDDLVAIDLDGDGRQEWLVTIFIPTADGQPVSGPPGDFWVVGQGGVVYRTFGDSAEAGLWSAPVVIGLYDLTGDKLPEAITETASCGAHTCYSRYDAVSAHHGPIGNIISGPIEEGAIMAYPTAKIFDGTDDGLPDLVLTGGIVASIGAGIQRQRSEIWAWDGARVALADTAWEPSPWRFHVLYDANLAFDSGDYGTARELYLRVINDATLQDTSEFPASGVTYDNTRQFAAFRLTLLGLLEADHDEAARWSDWLSLHYPDAPIQQAVVALMLEWLFGTGNLIEACAAATESLFAFENPTGTLAYLGYANPELTAEDVCPIR